MSNCNKCSPFPSALDDPHKLQKIGVNTNVTENLTTHLKFIATQWKEIHLRHESGLSATKIMY